VRHALPVWRALVIRQRAEVAARAISRRAGDDLQTSVVPRRVREKQATLAHRQRAVVRAIRPQAGRGLQTSLELRRVRGTKAVWLHRIEAAALLQAMAPRAIPRRTARGVQRVVSRCPAREASLLQAVLALVPAVALVAEELVLAGEAELAAAADKGTTMTDSKIIDMSARASRLASVCIRYALALALFVPLLGLAAGQKTFPTPEAAVTALADALKANDEASMIAIFGEAHKRLVVSPDAAENHANWSKALVELDAFHVLDDAGPDRRILLVGDEAWPMPIPLVRENGVWRFATELGEEEIINRRIGANEREALVVLRAYLDAQRQYASRDRNRDGVLEYAQNLGSTPGKQDGLYWPADANKSEESSPFGPLVAASSEYLKGHKPGDAYRGYHFRILTAQGPNAPGGAYSYIINGHMVAGFAMVAYPAEYGTSGVMTFIVSNNGIIYQKNLGKHPTSIKVFNPDASWKRVEDPF
jgi:Protein of unknown function (DUF2950)